jgi:hypothetical protein
MLDTTRPRALFIRRSAAIRDAFAVPYYSWIDWEAVMRLAGIAVFAAAAFFAGSFFATSFSATSFFAMSPVRAQTAPAAPAAENLAAARELMDVIKPTEQFKAILPTIFQNLKPAIVQNRPDVEKQYDAMTPMFAQIAQKHLTELADIIAGIYAQNFTVDELRSITAFYRTPAGQKLIAQQPLIAQQSMAAGAQFGRSIVSDIQQQMSVHQQ